MNKPPRTSMFAAWTMLILAGIGTGLAIEEQRKDAERPIELDYVKPGFVACTTQGTMEMYLASDSRDQVKMYVSQNCLTTDVLAGYPFVILNQGTSKVYKIRVALDDDQFADLFVPIEAITNQGVL